MTRWLALALCLVVACGDPASRREIAERLIEAEPAEFFDRLALVERVPVETWRFENPGDLRPWRMKDFDRSFAIEERALALASSKRHARLIRDVDWDAAAVDAVELRARDFRGGQVRLFWARGEERLTTRRSLLARAEAGGRFLFDLAGHPAWTGGIRQLGIQVSSPPGEQRQLVSVQALEYRPGTESVAQAVQRGWKIDLDHEVRSGLLALPGIPIDRKVTVPAAGILRVGYGVDARARGPIELSVSATPDHGDPVELFSARIDPAEDQQAGRWHDREIDLSRFAGEEVAIRLLTRTGAEEADLLGDLAFWSNPLVTREARGPARPNVVLISIDTLRADHLSLYGYARETSPFLDAWSGENAAVFENAVSTSPWTIPSHLSIFTGLDALRHGVNDADRIPGSHRMMAEILREKGYDTMAITGGGFVHPERGFVQGFDRYRYWPVAKSSGELENGLGHALEWLGQARDRPFFLFFHTFEVHYPYDARQPFFDRLSGGAEVPGEKLQMIADDRKVGAGFLLTKQLHWLDRTAPGRKRPVEGEDFQAVVDLYDSGVAFTDAQLRRLLGRLEELELDRSSIIVITSDHGEALGDKGLSGHAYLYDFNLMVPLIVALPDGRGSGERIASQVRSIDLLPTITELLGLGAPADVDGSSLVPLIEGRSSSHPQEAWSYSAFSNQGLSLRLGNRMKYVFNNTAWPPLHGRGQLYDLRSDPLETDDVAERSDRAAALRQRVQEAAGTARAVLRVSFSNSCAATLRGSMRGGAVQINTVKSADLPASALTWNGAAAEFTVEPGETFDVWVERFDRGRFLELEGAFDDGTSDDGLADDDFPECSGSFTERLAIDTPQGGWRLAHDGSTWSRAAVEAPEPAAPPTGLLVHWQRESGDEAEHAYVESPELLEQLKALGYVP
ncbi:MAG: sulfatase [bacterium]|nr:sulfatase [bacterium]